MGISHDLQERVPRPDKKYNSRLKRLIRVTVFQWYWVCRFLAAPLPNAGGFHEHRQGPTVSATNVSFVYYHRGVQIFVNQSTAGILITRFGTAGDQPVPNVYVR